MKRVGSLWTRIDALRTLLSKQAQALEELGDTLMFEIMLLESTRHEGGRLQPYCLVILMVRIYVAKATLRASKGSNLPTGKAA